MTAPLPIPTVSGPVRGEVRPPGSKSITNRALVCAALADGTSTITGALDSQDTRWMRDGLQHLGIEVATHQAGTTLVVQGTSGRLPALEADLFCGNSGTSIRFLTALCALGHGSFRLDGDGRMRSRPVADLLDALRQLGVLAVSERDSGCPPVLVHANGLPGGTATIRGDASSQFLSGLLMAAPAATGDVVLQVAGPLVSLPYVAMTVAVMRDFGIEVDTATENQYRVEAPREYKACDYAVEPDASAASYFWAAAAITGGEVSVIGLSRESLQGDVAFVDCLQQMGCHVSAEDDRITVRGASLRGIDVDMNAISDTAQTIAAVALFAEGPTTIRGIAHNRHKETDRIADLATELQRLGAGVDQHPDGLTVRPAPLRQARVRTYNDHRMAMSLALVGLRVPGILVEDPDCTAKTYPGYFQDLERLTHASP